MKKISLFITFIIILGISSCSKILNRVDFNGVPSTTVWNDSSTALLYLNNLYNLVIPVWPCDEAAGTLPTPIHNISDECNGTANNSSNILWGNLTVDQVTDFYTGTTSAYAKIRQINLLLSSIDSGSISANAKTQIKAQAYFLRAYTYFDLVKIYGGVPYVTTAQDWLTDSLLVYRNSTSDCINFMIADLNKCSILPASWGSNDYGRITRGAALALKARILLYWASPQLNPNNDMTRWQLAYTTNMNAYDSLIMDGYGMYSNFSRIFLDAQNKTDNEPIIFRAFNGSTTSGLYNTYDKVTRPYSQSSGSGGKTNNPTWNLVQAFPMANGKAITDPTSGYDSVHFWLNRDPRFYSTIVYNGAYFGLQSASGRRQWMYTGISDDKSAPSATGFYSRKNLDTTITNANSAYGKTSWVEMRFAEVMLNLAECANAVGDQTTAYNMLLASRKRAGIAAGTNNYYGLATTMTTAQMEAAILAERRVEFAFEGKRYDDLRRTRTFDQLNGLFRNQMVITPKSPYTVATLEKVLPGGGLARDTININSTDYTKYFTISFKPITGESVINFQTNYYNYGIPSTNILKDPNMYQTIGWTYGSAAGTFDPTK